MLQQILAPKINPNELAYDTKDGAKTKCIIIERRYNLRNRFITNQKLLIFLEARLLGPCPHSTWRTRSSRSYRETYPYSPQPDCIIVPLQLLVSGVYSGHNLILRTYET